MSDKKTINPVVKSLPEMRIAFARHRGPYQGQTAVFEKLFNTLMGWAGPRGLLADPKLQTLCVYHDDPETVPEAEQRVDAAILVPDGIDGENDIQTATLPGGQYAVASVTLQPDEFAGAWRSIMEWLSNTGYQPDDRPCIEIYKEQSNKPPFKLDICVPVKTTQK